MTLTWLSKNRLINSEEDPAAVEVRVLFDSVSLVLVQMMPHCVGDSVGISCSLVYASLEQSAILMSRKCICLQVAKTFIGKFKNPKAAYTLKATADDTDNRENKNNESSSNRMYVDRVYKQVESANDCCCEVFLT